MAHKLKFEREIGEQLRNGFYLRSATEDTGLVTDNEELLYLPKKRTVFTRIVDEVVQNGIYLRMQSNQKQQLWNLFRNEQTGMITDKSILYEVPYEKGDVLKITISPWGKNMLTIEIELIE
jgi:hypothetical protein